MDGIEDGRRRTLSKEGAQENKGCRSLESDIDLHSLPQTRYQQWRMLEFLENRRRKMIFNLFSLSSNTKLCELI